MNLLDILYPKRCALCDKIINDREYPVCFACRKWIMPIEGARCMHCSKPLDVDTEELCLDCGQQKFYYDQGFAVFLYEGRIRESLMRFKYGERQEYGSFYAKMLNLFAQKWVERWKPEVLIPVPVHATKLRKRGYNQAEILAKELSKIWKIPMDNHCMKRTKKTRAQKNLDNKERRKNLKEAFNMTHPVKYRCVLIVDDIYTTGSTVDTLAKLLKEYGVENVYFITVCIGKGI